MFVVCILIIKIVLIIFNKKFRLSYRHHQSNDVCIDVILDTATQLTVMALSDILAIAASTNMSVAIKAHSEHGLAQLSLSLSLQVCCSWRAVNGNRRRDHALGSIVIISLLVLVVKWVGIGVKRK